VPIGDGPLPAADTDFGGHSPGAAAGSIPVQAFALDADARICDITSFHTPEAFARFGLADQVAP
jgi:hypothetical protein